MDNFNLHNIYYIKYIIIKGTKELFSSNHAIFCCLLHEFHSSQEMAILDFWNSKFSGGAYPSRKIGSSSRYQSSLTS